MYEQQKSENGKSEPTHLMEHLKDIINEIELGKEIYTQDRSISIFKFKEKIPMRQILALYGVNKISTLTNKTLN